MKFTQAPVMDGGAMFHLLQAAERPGAVVSAFDPVKNEPVWQTWLAAPW